MPTPNPIQSLRAQMRTHGIGAYVITGLDPHLCEYPPDRWRAREWLSGFTGSAGTLVVTPTAAALWTDSRYFVQADLELAGRGVALMRQGEPGTPTPAHWIADRLPPGRTAAFDGRTLAHGMALELIHSLEQHGLRVIDRLDLVSPIWPQRPPPPGARAWDYPLEYCGEGAPEKIARIHGELLRQGANTLLVGMLDEVAWTLNLRGADIPYNPVTTAYLLIANGQAQLFIDPRQLDPPLAHRLARDGVEVLPYGRLEDTLAALPPPTVMLIDERRLNHALVGCLPKGVGTVRETSPPCVLKARKSDTELQHIRRCMEADGVAMCQLLRWVEDTVGHAPLGEAQVAAMARALRGQQQGFISESFPTIAAHAGHGALVHYAPSPAADHPVAPEGFLLIDSGGQYLGGTTDITRTWHLGVPTPQERSDYTLVLKGLIALSAARFPMGTRGSQLDTLARSALWAHGLNYGHGTGHGVGAFLNVHEGPQSLRPSENPVTIEPGMVQSVEPGLYRQGQHGIRLENVVACVPYTQNPFGTFYQFETLTLCPIDTRPILPKMLTPGERAWLNGYHQEVFRRLSASLSGSDWEWLRAKTLPMG